MPVINDRILGHMRALTPAQVNEFGGGVDSSAGGPVLLSATVYFGGATNIQASVIDQGSAAHIVVAESARALLHYS
jgi:hypothetical protein